MRRLFKLAKTFTPGSPVSKLEDFTPRLELVSDVFSVIAQTGQHVALFGDRGVGKTSLANILGQSFSDRSGTFIRSVRVGCTSGDTFDSLWRLLFRKLKVTLDDGPLTPHTITEVLDDLNFHAMLVIDEVDRFDDDQGLSLLADTLKALSDLAVDCTLVLVGVSDSIDELIGDHRSIGRALVQVKVPRMSRAELRRIVETGMTKLNLTGSREQWNRIAMLSEGLPYYTHQLCYYAAERAIHDDKQDVSKSDVDNAIKKAVEKGQDSVRRDYAKAIRSPRKDNLFEDVLLACALATKDEIGYFAPRHVREPLEIVLGRPVSISAYMSHLNKFTEEARGPILQREGAKRKWIYRFVDPMLQPHVVLAGVGKGKVTESQIKPLLRKDRRDMPLHG